MQTVMQPRLLGSRSCQRSHRHGRVMQTLAPRTARLRPSRYQRGTCCAAQEQDSVENEAQAVHKPGPLSWFRAQHQKAQQGKDRLKALGSGAVLAYGALVHVSTTAVLVTAFLAYEARTGLNPVKNLVGVFKLYALMAAGNSAAMPLRLAGAAALAPVVDKVTGVLENRFGFNKFWSSTVVMGSIIGVSVFVVGGLFLSRLVF